MTHVSVEAGAKTPRGILRRHRHAFAACQPACEAGVTGGAGIEATEQLTGPPPVQARREQCLELLVRGAFGVVVCPPEAGARVDEHQRRAALGVGGGELQRRGAQRVEHNYPFATDVVDHCDHVVNEALRKATLLRGDRIR